LSFGSYWEQHLPALLYNADDKRLVAAATSAGVFGVAAFEVKRPTLKFAAY